ncbi:MAG: ATP-dependent DNA helicase [Ktedonobacteraceae bacterium]
MTIALELENDFRELNDAQKKVVTHDSGPIMVIAGPGSGKTRCLVLRAMNLLLLKKAEPQELVLCTYTKKAAIEMLDRLLDTARRVRYNGDISLIRVGTIHSICERIITENLHRMLTHDYQGLSIGDNFETLDRLTQRLFIFENLEIIGGKNLNFFANRWGPKWKVVKQLQMYFGKITEELIDIKTLSSRNDYFLFNLAQAYDAYQGLLMRKNCVDFAFLQKIVHDLLINTEISHYITEDIRYVLVDEYQDTNYIQEQIIVKLASKTDNIFVVGDEDQSLYRFRGATVQNIRNFLKIFPDAARMHLTINYRSHREIINTCNSWMSSIEWGNYRSNKKIQARSEEDYAEYPATLSLGQDIYDEAQQFAEFVSLLKEKGHITNYSQIALLMHSVKTDKSSLYIQALKEKGISAYCPRAGTYFEQEEVRLIIGCFGGILHFNKKIRSDIVEYPQIQEYIEQCESLLVDTCESFPALMSALHDFEKEISQQVEGQNLNKCMADYFYSLLAIEPFTTFLAQETKRQNLMIFSQLLQTFQRYYQYDNVCYENREEVGSHFFNQFLCLYFEDSTDQFDSPAHLYPKNQVLVMTIHQAKGLEFPVVVVVGGPEIQSYGLNDVDKCLRSFYQRPQFEPVESIPRFDFMRLYYVAFSRARDLLVLTGNQSHKKPSCFSKIMQELPQWPYAQSELSALKVSEQKDLVVVPKPRYSYTGHIKMYETCPRQYQFYQEYQFVPSRPSDTFTGLLVHQTIEKIHRLALDKQIPTLTQTKLRDLFEQTYYFLALTDMPSLDERDKEKAFKQVENYFYNNQLEMYDVKNVEEQVAIMKDDYILTGKIDVVMERNGKREIWDLKTSSSLVPDSIAVENYERQLYMYAHALEQRDKIPPERLILYWTEKSIREDAMMIIPYQQNKVDAAVKQFETVVNDIKAQKFAVVTPPHPHICKKCDLRSRCTHEGIIHPY